MTAKHRVVIIGSGFGGLFAAKRLKRADAEVTLISRVSHHTFQPLLYQVATGILSQGEIAPATREILKRQDNVEVLLGDVTTIDLSARTVTSSVGVLQTITEYDSLIVAAGATTGYFGNDEFEPFAPGLKSIDDALELRARVFGAFEMAELQQEAADAEPWMTFVVVGAGPTGVELAGQIVELSHRTLKRDFRRIDPRDARVILVEGGDGVLSSFGPKQSRRAGEQLERMGIDVRLQGMVEDVDESGVTVKYRDGSTQHIATRCVLWAAGVAASPLGRQLAEQSGAGLDRAGRVQVRSDLTLPGHDEVFVIGDMIALDDLPGVAQVAMQGAKFSAKKIRARIDGKPEPTQFSYFDKGSMATIGRSAAVAMTPFNLQMTGPLAWLAWLFVHLMFLIDYRNRVIVLMRWTWKYFGWRWNVRLITAPPEQSEQKPPDESS